MFKAAPLSSTYMLVSIIGFIASIIYYPRLGVTWGTLFIIMFFMFFIASIISMTHTTIDADLAVHESHHIRKRRKQSKK